MFMSRVLLSLMLSSALAAPMIQAQNRVIVSGRTPLTGEIADKTRFLLEWLLDVRFSPQQAREYEQILARDWNNEKDRRGTLAMFELAKKVESVSEEKRQRAHDAMQTELLKGMRENTGAENTRWLLAVYEQQHDRAAMMPVAAGPANDGPLGRVIVGKWRTTTVRAIQYQNSYTGVSAPTNGLSVFYEFAPDGSYSMNGTMQVTSYNCTSVIYNAEKGRYRLQGAHLFLEPATGVNRYQNNCAPSSNREVSKTMGNREYELKLEPNAVGEQQLVMHTPGSNSRPDYYKRDR